MDDNLGWELSCAEDAMGGLVNPDEEFGSDALDDQPRSYWNPKEFATLPNSKPKGRDVANLRVNMCQ